MMKQHLFIFLFILLEYSCFPISSEVLLPFAGAAASGSGLPFILVVLYSTLAGSLGISLAYLIGRTGGQHFLNRLVKRFPSTEKSIHRSYRFFADHGKSALFLGRMVPICRTYISFVAGSAKMTYPIYLAYSVLGIGLWNSLLTAFGYYFYEYRTILWDIYEKYKRLFLLSLALIILGFLLRRFKAKSSDSGQ